MNTNNYISANSMPLKVMKYIPDCKDGIQPIHLQLCPTNKCNLNCDFCSCSSVERTQELSRTDLLSINLACFGLGIKAITITGGGEPTIHPDIDEFITDANSYDIKLGLTTNGLALKNLKPDTFDCLTWCRISFDSSRKFDAHFIDQLKYAMDNGRNVDWAFSYVVTANENNIENMIKIVDFANANDFTHVRFVPDLYDIDNVDMKAIEELLSKHIDTSRCIFQNRQAYTKGSKSCSISLLKPMIAPDGYIYPCCGVQYALKGDDKQRMFPKEMRMGHYLELPFIIKDQKKYDGSTCVKCYYENYNTLLNALETNYDHQEFV